MIQLHCTCIMCMLGNINEWRVNSLLPVQSVVSKGSTPIWSMDINSEGSSLVIGCENGEVSLSRS